MSNSRQFSSAKCSLDGLRSLDLRNKWPASHEAVIGYPRKWVLLVSYLPGALPRRLGDEADRIRPMHTGHTRGRKIEEMMALRVDDSLRLGTPDFMREKKSTREQFKFMGRILLANRDMGFNALALQQHGQSILMKEAKNIDGINYPSSQQSFISTRSLVRYIGVFTRPYVCHGSNVWGRQLNQRPQPR